MGKKLAIKGHPTRGKEVIELLEMIGGDNRWKASGEIEKVYYSISNGVILYGPQIVKDTVIFTLEEFLEKYPFKIGDKVIDKADGCPGIVNEMKWDADVSDMKYCVVFGNGIDFGWFANDSIEFCKEDKNLDENKFPSLEPMFKLNDELEYKIPDGYEITEVSKNTIFIKPIKPKYPTTYEECCEIIHSDPNFYIDTHLYSGSLETLYKLLICRTAYWKIAGKEMGLDKPWEPDCKDNYQKKWTISFYQGEINLTNGPNVHRILAFPTEEVRDAFYENFKDLIEQCKEML